MWDILNVGYSYETLGNLVEASRFYRMAADSLDDVPDGPYKNVLLNGIEGGFKRIEASSKFFIRITNRFIFQNDKRKNRICKSRKRCVLFAKSASHFNSLMESPFVNIPSTKTAQ